MEYGYDDDDEELVGIPWMVLIFFFKKKMERNQRSYLKACTFKEIYMFRI